MAEKSINEERQELALQSEMTVKKMRQDPIAVNDSIMTAPAPKEECALVYLTLICSHYDQF